MGVFTNFLVSHDYLPPNARVGQHIKYSIEVKTTTDTCEAPFYMSNSQYIRMQRQSVNNNFTSPPDKLYVIFRVYTLGRSSIGLRVLIDPEQMRQTGALQFTAESWAVIIRD
ncbi:hypothetical protein BX600DRAFT_474958 [Xylariales sp. PMI_506]|nr:hypothetical protein BX600DRAFT_474958 [Xylariales sp. PMI_506]